MPAGQPVYRARLALDHVHHVRVILGGGDVVGGEEVHVQLEHDVVFASTAAEDVVRLDGADSEAPDLLTQAIDGVQHQRRPFERRLGLFDIRHLPQVFLE